MKLFYFRHKNNLLNFGDDINPWLWNKLLPGHFETTNDYSLFVGIGTLINRKIPHAKKYAVLGSGVGYGDLPKIDESWRIYALRGPLSAKRLGVEPGKAVTDGAVLLRKVVTVPGEKKFRYSYMPHLASIFASEQGLIEVCDKIGINYISPNTDPLKTLDAILNTEILITEALHGAIVADAFRIPWIPIVFNSDYYQFKWADWCQSVSLNYHSLPLMPFWDPPKGGTGLQKARYRIKLKVVETQLRWYRFSSKPSLSENSISDENYEKLLERLDLFKRDYASGMFSNEATSVSMG